MLHVMQQNSSIILHPPSVKEPVSSIYTSIVDFNLHSPARVAHLLLSKVRIVLSPETIACKKYSHHFKYKSMAIQQRNGHNNLSEFISANLLTVAEKMASWPSQDAVG
jgi:hypothetical protein